MGFTTPMGFFYGVEDDNYTLFSLALFFFYGVEDDNYTLFSLALFSLTAHLSAVVSSVNDPVSFRQSILPKACCG